MRQMVAFAVAIGPSLAAFAGCGSEGPKTEPTCETLGCPEGSSCVSSLCLADAPDTYPVAVRFVPSGGEAVEQWTSLRVLSEPEEQLYYRFRDAVHVQGLVTRAGRNVDVRVELSRDVPLPGRAPRVFGRSVRREAFFDITVPAGLYRMTVWSTSPSTTFPPVRQDVDARADTQIDVVVPDSVGLTGAVKRYDASLLPNVRVWAVDPETGEAVSTVGRTGDQSPPGDAVGTFRLEIPVAVQQVVMRAAESDDTWARALPTIGSSAIDVTGLAFDEADHSYALPTNSLTYPAVQWVQLSGTVEGRPRAGGRVTVGGAILRFVSSELGPPGSGAGGAMDRLVVADGDGAFVVQLPAGSYDVEITPPSDSASLDLGVGRVSQFVNASPDEPFQSGIVLEAPQRVTLGGTVRDASGRPIEGATVELRGGGELGDRLLAAAENGVRSVTARTTREGAFLALVDGGHFDAVIRPPEGSGLPWGIRLALPVSEDQTLEEPLVVPPGRLLRGGASDQDGAPAPDVGVEVWCLTAEPVDGEPLPAAVQCGRTRTDADGRYELLLPASLGVADEPASAD